MGRARGGRLRRRRALMLRRRMTADLPSRRVSERVEPWTTPVAPINWTQVLDPGADGRHGALPLAALAGARLLGPLEIDIKC